MASQTLLPKKIFAILFIFGAISVLLFRYFPTAAERPAAVPKPVRPENYDLRTARDERAARTLAEFTGESPQTAGRQRKSAARAARRLRALIPNLRVEYDDALGVPEIVAIEAGPQTKFLTGPRDTGRAAALRAFLKQNSALFGLAAAPVDALETTADYANPDGRLAFVGLAQSVGGIPVFGGGVRAAFTRRGEIVRIVNNLAPGLDEANPSTDFGDPLDAVKAAAAAVDDELPPAGRARNERLSTAMKAVFGAGERATTAEKTYFPLAPGVARPAWRVLWWGEPDAFYIVVDAATGTLLWRKNITQYQTQPATYNVYGSATSLLKTADSPTAFTPGCLTPLVCPEPPIIDRQSFTLIGNEPPYNFNNLGWIPDGENRTIGNAVEAGIDRDGIQGVDPNGHAVGSPNRTFVFNYNPAPGNPPPGDAPLQTFFQNGSVTNAFYVTNRFHDETYRLGFTEAAGNFQTDNFGRGGVGNDSLSVEVQDSSGTNNINFSTPADGGRGRLQLFIWTGSTPNRDGALDAQTIVHELTHGLSSRLVGNGSGLGGNMARGMGEGWSDFYALALLSEPADNDSGTYAIGGYVLNGFSTAPYYYGLRRFPLALKSSVGANNLPFDPLTFGNLNAGNCSNFQAAFPPNPGIAAPCDSALFIGEVWASALWEMRHQLILRHGADDGNRRALQYITDGMKLSPLNPTMLQGRDAIIAAAAVVDSADAAAVRRGFAIRGMGYSATIVNAGSGNNTTGVIEAFDELPNVVIAPGFTVSDAPGNNNGYPDRGEHLALVVPLVNPNGFTVTGVSVQVAGGGTASYGDIAAGQTVTRNIDYTFPADPCAASAVTLTFTITGTNATTRTETRRIFLGVPGGVGQTFANSTPVTINDAGPSSPYGTSISVSGVTGVRNLRLDLLDLSHSFPGDVDMLLVGPGGQTFEVMSDQGGDADLFHVSLSLTDSALTALPSAIATGTYRPTADGSAETFPAPAPAGPYNLPAPGGTATFATVYGSATANGTWTLYIMDDAATDTGSLAGGWSLTLEPPVYLPLCLSRTRGDFDGDGRADVAVFRPSDGVWYLNRSTAGFTAARWGISTDQPVPGDFDGDFKTDVAVFRPTADPAQPDFYILNSSTLGFNGVSWGLPGDLPAIGDYDGDGRDDLAVFRPSNHTFYVLRSAGGVLTFSGIADGLPVTGDFDGDGKADFVTYLIDGWLTALSSANYATVNFTRWGLAGDKPVAADYDGDGKADLAVFRPSEGVWYISGSTAGNLFVPFGIATDVPAPADFDGDGRADVAVYRSGTWYVNRSSSGLLITQFGLAGDRPLPNAYLP